MLLLYSTKFIPALPLKSLFPIEMGIAFKQKTDTWLQKYTFSVK